MDIELCERCNVQKGILCLGHFRSSLLWVIKVQVKYRDSSKCLTHTLTTDEQQEISMKKKGQKERLKPISFYGYNPEDVIRAFMQVDPKKIREREEEERKLDEELDTNTSYSGSKESD